jgi:membrane fusion protein, multidrug efflux system
VQEMQSNLLATMSSIDPLWVYFAISEREAMEVNKLRLQKRLGQASTGKTGDKLPIQMILEDGSSYPHPGVYDFASPNYDSSTGTLTLRAEFPNPEKFLRPGNYAKVRMIVTERPDALLVSERAVGTDQGGKFLMIVNGQNTVERRAVTLGVQHEGMVEIASGLQGDERVVVNGLQRARPGAVVDPQLQKTGAAKPEAAAGDALKGRP